MLPILSGLDANSTHPDVIFFATGANHFELQSFEAAVCPRRGTQTNLAAARVHASFSTPTLERVSSLQYTRNSCNIGILKVGGIILKLAPKNRETYTRGSRMISESAIKCCCRFVAISQTSIIHTSQETYCALRPQSREC